jgi:hypothetical protein
MGPSIAQGPESGLKVVMFSGKTIDVIKLLQRWGEGGQRLEVRQGLPVRV